MGKETKITAKFSNGKEPIVAKYWVDDRLDCLDTASASAIDLSGYDNVELLIKGKEDRYDTFMAWDNGKEEIAVIFLGFWNSGKLK